jgi:predicted  nucleic acid-binding Zn-ribbon protein
MNAADHAARGNLLKAAESLEGPVDAQTRLRAAAPDLRKAVKQLEDEEQVEARLLLSEIEDIRVRSAALEDEITDVRVRIETLARRLEGPE